MWKKRQERPREKSCIVKEMRESMYKGTSVKLSNFIGKRGSMRVGASKIFGGKNFLTNSIKKLLRAPRSPRGRKRCSGYRIGKRGPFPYRGKGGTYRNHQKKKSTQF